MNPVLALQGAQLISNIVSSFNNTKNASSASKAQKRLANKYYNYNKNLLNESYNEAYNNIILDYITNRLNITEEYSDMKTQLNIQSSQAGVNLSDSSYTNDIQSKLDNEFITNLQNNYTNLFNKGLELSGWKASSDLDLSLNYMNQVNKINQTYDSVQNSMFEKVMSNAIDFGTTYYKESRASDAKQEIANKYGFNLIDTDISSGIDFSKFKL